MVQRYVNSFVHWKNGFDKRIYEIMNLSDGIMMVTIANIGQFTAKKKRKKERNYVHRQFCFCFVRQVLYYLPVTNNVNRYAEWQYVVIYFNFLVCFTYLFTALTRQIYKCMAVSTMWLQLNCPIHHLQSWQRLQCCFYSSTRYFFFMIYVRLNGESVAIKCDWNGKFLLIKSWNIRRYYIVHVSLTS